jgi:fumarate hydratase class II
MMPVMGATMLETCQLLAAATRAFIDFCALGMEANAEACQASVEDSLAMVTSLNPHIGYERAAALAKEAFKTGKTIRQLCREQKILPDEVLDKVLDPRNMTKPEG